MTENFLANIAYCKDIVFELKNLLFYTHIPAAVATLLLSFFVYVKNRTTLLSRILLGIAISFSVWVILNLIIWLKFDNPALVMAAWAPIEVVKIFCFFLCWYFVYVFVEKKDFSLLQKIFWAVVFIAFSIISVSSLNITSYDLPQCLAIESPIFTALTFWVEVGMSTLLILYIGRALFRKKIKEKRPLMILGVGIITFVLSFFILGQLSEITQNYAYEAVGLFGMVIFIASMAYLMLQYSVFNIKIIATQLLVAILVILTASQLTFTSGYTTILASITTVFAIIFSYLLIRSVRREVLQRERLQELSINLEHANEKLKSLDKLKTEFLSLASHQLRSPLTAIKGYSSMLIEGAYGTLEEKINEPVKRIYTSAQGLVNIVEDLLNVSKIEQGGMKYEMAEIDLVPIVTNLFNEMQIPAQDKHIAFEMHVRQGQSFIVKADATKLKQVFLNLVDNSIKYTPSGGMITISLSRTPTEIRFAVRDTGMGISEETRAKLFEKFSRGEAGKTNTGGSGLGLYLARQITIAHKGDITIESEGIGKGTMFTVTLPIV